MKNGHGRFHHAGSPLSFPTKECTRARTATIHHRAHLATVFGLAARAVAPIIRSGATACASPRGSSSRSWCRCWCSAAPTKGSPTPLARRARCVAGDEWIELGVMEKLRRICLDAYDRLIGLELSEVAVDC